jgi:hypothetical protein
MVPPDSFEPDDDVTISRSFGQLSTKHEISPICHEPLQIITSSHHHIKGD